MARFFNLYSGSKGNSTYIGNGNGAILVDAGRSAKQLIDQLNEREMDPSTLCGVFITHEHTDHISALNVFLKKYKIPVFATKGTLLALEEMNVLPADIKTVALMSGENVECGGMQITPFKTSHDSRESCGYRIITSDDRTVSICTDLGEIDQSAFNGIFKSDLLMLESNHDVKMLQNGNYPYSLKMRILGNRGHLSNDTCSKILPTLVESGTARIMLAHLSSENNYPYIAENYAKDSLHKKGIEIGKDCLLTVLEEKSTQKVTIF